MHPSAQSAQAARPAVRAYCGTVRVPSDETSGSIIEAEVYYVPDAVLDGADFDATGYPSDILAAIERDRRKARHA